MQLLAWLVIICVRRLKLSEAAKADVKCTEMAAKGIERFQDHNLFRLNQFRQFHNLTELRLANDGKRIKFKIFSNSIAKTAEEVAERACEAKLPKPDENSLIYSREHSNKDYRWIMDLYCGSDLNFKNLGSASAQDEWKRLLFSSEKNEVAFAAFEQRPKAAKENEGTDFFALILPTDAVRLTDTTKLTEAREIRKRVALPCGLPGTLDDQMYSGYNIDQLCQEPAPDAEAKFQDDFANRLNEYRKLHGVKEEVKVARDGEGKERELATNLAHMACYGNMQLWEKGLDTRLPAYKLLEETKDSHKQLLYRRQKLEPKLTGKELADAIYCNNEAVELRQTKYVSNGKFNFKLSGRDWLLLVAPSKVATANVFGLRQSWRVGGRHAASTDNYAVVRPIAAALTDEEASKQEEIRSRLMPACDEPPRLDELVKKGADALLKLAKPIAKEVQDKEECKLPPDWGTNFREKISQRWNAYRNLHGLKPVKFVGISKPGDGDVRSEATQDAWEMVKKACDGKDDKKRDGNHLLFSSSFTSRNGVPADYFVDSIYCGIDTNIKISKDEKFKGDEWQKLLFSVGQNAVVAADILRGHVAIVLPGDAKPLSEAEAQKHEKLRKLASLQCEFTPAMTQQLAQIYGETNTDYLCHDYSDKEEATFQDEFEKRWNQYRRFHSQPEVKIARSGKNDDPKHDESAQRALDLARISCYGYKIEPDKSYNSVDGEAQKRLYRSNGRRNQVLFTRQYTSSSFSGKQFADAIYCNEQGLRLRRDSAKAKDLTDRDWLHLLLPAESDAENVFGLRRSWRKPKEGQKDSKGQETHSSQNYALDIASNVIGFDSSVKEQHEAVRNILKSFCGKDSAAAQLDEALAHPEKHGLVIKKSTDKCALTKDMGKSFRDEIKQRWNEFRELHGLTPVDVIGIDKSQQSVRNKATEIAAKIVKESCEATEAKEQPANHLLYFSEEEAFQSYFLEPVPGEYLANAMYCDDYQIVKRRHEEGEKEDASVKENGWQVILSPNLGKVAVDIIRQTNKDGKIIDIVSVILPDHWKPPSSSKSAEIAKLRKHVVMQCISPLAMRQQLVELKKDKDAVCHDYSDDHEVIFQKQFEERVNQFRKLHGQPLIEVSAPAKGSGIVADINERALNAAVMICANKMIFPEVDYKMMKVEALKVVERTSGRHRQHLFRQAANEPEYTGKQLADAIYCDAKTVQKGFETYDHSFKFYSISNTWELLMASSANPRDNLFAARRTWIVRNDGGKSLRRNYYALVQPQVMFYDPFSLMQHRELRMRLTEACDKMDTAKIDEILKNPEQHTLTIKEGSSKCRITPDGGSDVRRQFAARLNALRSLHGMFPVTVVGIDLSKASVRNEATMAAWQIAKDSCEQKDGSKTALAPNEMLFVSEEHEESKSDRKDPPYGEFLVNEIYCSYSERVRERKGTKEEDLKLDAWQRLFFIAEESLQIALDIVYEKRPGLKQKHHYAIVLPKIWELPTPSALAVLAKRRQDVVNACYLPPVMSKQLSKLVSDKNAFCHVYAEKEEAEFREQFEKRLNEYRRLHGQPAISIAKPTKSGKPDNDDMHSVAKSIALNGCYDYRFGYSSYDEDKVEKNYAAWKLYNRLRPTHALMVFERQDNGKPLQQLSGKQFMDAIYCNEKDLRVEDQRKYKELGDGETWKKMVLASEDKQTNVFGLQRTWIESKVAGKKTDARQRSDYYAVTRPNFKPLQDYVATQHEHIRSEIKKLCDDSPDAAQLDQLLAHPEKSGLTVKEDTGTCVTPNDFGTSFRSDLEDMWNSYRKVHDLSEIKVVGIGRFGDIVRSEETQVAWDLVKNSCDQKDGVTQDANRIVFRLDYDDTKKNADVTARELLSAIYCASEEQPLSTVQGTKVEKAKEEDWLKLLFISQQDSVAVDIIKHKSGEKLLHASVSFVLPKDWKPPTAAQLAKFSVMRKNVRKMCFLSFPMSRVLTTAKEGDDAYCHEYSDLEEAKFQEEFEMRLNQFRRAHKQADVKIERRTSKGVGGKMNDIVQVTDDMALLSCYGFILQRNGIQHTNAWKRLKGIVGTHRPIIYERSYTQPKLTGKEVADAIYCSNKAFSERLSNGASYELQPSHWQRLLQPVASSASGFTIRRTWIIWKPPSEEKSQSMARRETYAFMVPKSKKRDAKTAAYNEAVREKLIPLCGKPQLDKLDKMLDELAENPLKPDAADLKKAEQKVAGENDQADQKGGLEDLSEEDRKKASSQRFVALQRKLAACQNDVERMYYTDKNVENKEANAAVKAGMDRLFSCDSTERLKAKFWEALSSLVPSLPTFGNGEQEPDGVEIRPENGLDPNGESVPKKDTKPKAYAKAAKMKSKWMVDCMLRRIPEIRSVNEQEFYKYYGKKDKATIREVEALIVGIRCSTGDVSVNGDDAYAELRKFGNTWFKAMREMFDGWKAYIECFAEEASHGHVTISMVAGCSKDTEFYEATMAKCQNAVDPNSKFHIKFPPTVAELEAAASKSAFKRRIRNAVCAGFRASGRAIGKTVQVAGAVVGGPIKGVILLFIAILHFCVLATIPAMGGAAMGFVAGPVGMGVLAAVMVALSLPIILPIVFESMGEFEFDL